jgi:hypothetical protein
MVTVSSSFASSSTTFPDCGVPAVTLIYNHDVNYCCTKKNQSSELRTLSVSIVATSSPAATKSPTCFDHVFSVPSVIDSAIWGTLTVYP